MPRTKSLLLTSGSIAMLVLGAFMVRNGTVETSSSHPVVRWQADVGRRVSTASYSVPEGSVSIAPGRDIQRLLDESPAGTTYLLKAGVHRLQSIVPKDGDAFLGEPGTVLNGARLLEGFQHNGDFWTLAEISNRGQAAGYCESGREACIYPEDLFIDDQLVRRVSRLSEIGPGRWYFDYVHQKIYLADDPGGRRVELSVTRHAFSGNAKNVTIRGIVIEKYAQPGQFAAVQAHEGSGWLIEGNEVRFNHAAGVSLGPGSVLRANNLHHNGQLGVKGGYEDSLIENNVLAYNNTADFDRGWEAGGAKFSHTTGLTVRNNLVVNNFGTGLWTDIDNRGTIYEGNEVRDNEGKGIFHEISYDAVIRGNKLSGNGLSFHPWLWGGQIVIANSSNVQIFENEVTVPASGGDGITLIQANRGRGKYGLYVTANNYIHDNEIYYLGRKGQTGADADHDDAGLANGNNLFDYNRYYVLDANAKLWNWLGDHDWRGFRARGQERNGRLILVSVEAAKRPGTKP